MKPNPIHSAIVAEVKKRKLTMYKIEQDTGVSQVVIRYYLAGRHDIGSGFAAKLMAYLGISIKRP